MREGRFYSWRIYMYVHPKFERIKDSKVSHERRKSDDGYLALD
jgi:hypothetical protein